MTNNTKRKWVIVSGIILCLYSFYRIFNSLYYLFNPIQLTQMTPVKILRYMLLSSVGSLGLLTLGIGAFLLVYADLNRHKSIDIHTRFNRLKQTVFAVFILSSFSSIIQGGYNTFISIQSYQIYIEQKSAQGDMFLTFLTSILQIPFAIFLSIGGILFGLYILSGKENLRKVGLALYFIGTIFLLIGLTYNFVYSMVYYSQNSSNFINYAITMTQIYKMIFSFVTSILIRIASLIIVLYGTKKKRINLDENVYSIETWGRFLRLRLNLTGRRNRPHVSQSLSSQIH